MSCPGVFLKGNKSDGKITVNKLSIFFQGKSSVVDIRPNKCFLMYFSFSSRTLSFEVCSGSLTEYFYLVFYDDDNYFWDTS